ncbi:MAG TPA: hypothetical protein VN493_01085 [Thermoanaerobaculia bacterium]|nr:hypothetical protein [Thermoanaerobaculia bacterium]
MRAPVPALALTVGLTLAGSLCAQREIVGSHGEIYAAKSGTYAELFPKGTRPHVDAPVLALEVIRPGAATERYLVPGTDGFEIEDLPFLYFEEASETTYLVWKSQNGVHPTLMLTGFDGRRWTEPLEILNNPMAEKTSSQIAVTHDTYRVAGEDEARHRTILHLLWAEEGHEAFYSPIVLENGKFVGKNPVFLLTGLEGLEAASSPEPSEPLLRSLRIQPGRDGQTVVATFISPDTRRVVSVEIDVLPAQLSQLADEARIHIIDIGNRHTYPAQLKQIADIARIHIIDIGRSFYPEIAGALAQQVQELILASDGKKTDLKKVADGARIHIIDIGAKLSGRGLRSASSAASVRTEEIAGSATVPMGPNGDQLPLSHFIQFRAASSRPVPEVGTGAVTFIASKTGEDILIAWAGKDRVSYRVSQDDGWSDVHQIVFSAGIGVERAYEILEQKMRNR